MANRLSRGYKRSSRRRDRDNDNDRYYPNNSRSRRDDDRDDRRDSGRKHSGARWIAKCNNKAGNPAILAWNYSRRHGLLDIFVAPYVGTHEVTSEKGRKWQNWMISIKGKGIDRHFPVLVDVDQRMAVVRDGWNWVLNCNAPHGGYCGQYSRSDD